MLIMIVKSCYQTATKFFVQPRQSVKELTKGAMLCLNQCEIIPSNHKTWAAMGQNQNTDGPVYYIGNSLRVGLVDVGRRISRFRFEG
jgi:hypothetical protein